jgi:hypothetical protein
MHLGILPFFFAGGLMPTRWSDFPILLPYAAAGALGGAILGWLLSRFVQPPRRLAVLLALALLASGYADVFVADLDWLAWAEPHRRGYLLGGLEAVVLAWAIIGLVSFALMRAATHLAAWRQRARRPPPSSAA